MERNRDMFSGNNSKLVLVFIGNKGITSNIEINRTFKNRNDIMSDMIRQFCNEGLIHKRSGGLDSSTSSRTRGKFIYSLTEEGYQTYNWIKNKEAK